jgi:putative transposase
VKNAITEYPCFLQPPILNEKNYPQDLIDFRVDAKDRKFQFRERNPLSIGIWPEKTLLQKLNYIHENPVRAGLCKYPDDYKYSSVLFYKFGKDNRGFLTHLRD